MFLCFQDHRSSTALGFLLLRLQPVGFQAESLKPHLRFPNIGRKMSLFKEEWFPHSRIIVLSEHYCRKDQNYNSLSSAMLRRVYSAVGHTHACTHAHAELICIWMKWAITPSLLIKQTISVYREIKGQIHTYLFENYDSAPAKTWVMKKILLIHATVKIRSLTVIWKKKMV